MQMPPLPGFLEDTLPTLRTLSDPSHTGALTSWATWNTSADVVVVAGDLAQFPSFFDSGNAIRTDMKGSTGTQSSQYSSHILLVENKHRKLFVI